MFTHLHVHTEYSLLDGMCRIPQLVRRAKDLGMASLAITDHGVMYGAIEFYREARQAGIKPIIGCEFYIAPGDRRSRTPADKNSYHLILLAKDQAGYHNLIQLTTKAHLEGFYYKPRVDRELLEQHRQGLVALSACLSGEVASLILARRFDDARQAALWYRQTFGDFYLEIMRNPVPELENVNAHLIQMAKELGIPLAATNDTHYINKEDASAHDLLLCIGTNASIHDEKRLKMAGDFFYLKSPEEMAAAFRDIPEALENTGRIADMCHLDLEFGRLHLPEIELPEGRTPDQFLADLCRRDLRKYYPDPTPEIEQRLEYELEVIEKTQFANYFLVVWDIMSFVKKQNILFGVRGSAAASIVLYCLGITAVDPVKHGLVFERFLNIERKEMPDIDMDFQDDRRDEVIQYVSQKYGPDHVAQIITFGTLGARAAIRDVGRALGMPYGDVDRVARLVPAMPNMTLQRAMEENHELKTIYESDEIVRGLVNQARRVEGIARHASTHAAGVVISREPLTGYVPLQKASRGGEGEEKGVMTQFSMGDIARIGLLKMDFLGLANLTILGKARDIIRQRHGKAIDLYKLPMDDKKTFELLSSGETAGVFQLEGAGMRRYIKDLRPNTFSDISAMVALYRPGPMEHIPRFIDSKHGKTPITYPHPALANILKETYGVIVYQDQVLFIVREFAGYSLGQADIFRKAMGKKDAEVMKKEKRSFISGAKKQGYSTDIAEQVFALIEPFAGYAFNKAHSVSYALIAYQTAYLKANYPAEYMTAFLTIHSGQLEKVAGAVAEARRLNINVLPPDINRSQLEFSIERNQNESAIRFGLAAIKNVGSGAIEPLLNERNTNGGFKSIEDLCRRSSLQSVNRRVMESLIKAGTFDSLEERGTLLNSVGRVLSLAQREQKLRDTGQSIMFDLFGESTAVPLPDLEMAPAATPDREKAFWEKELMGVSFSEKPFSPVFGREVGNAVFCGQIEAELDKQVIVTAGRLISVRYSFTKKNEEFAIGVLEDFSGQIEVIAWPRVYSQTEELWKEGNELVVQGKVRARDDEVSIVCDNVSYYQPPDANKLAAAAPRPASRPPAPPAPEKPLPAPEEKRRLIINLHQTADKDGDIDRLNRVLAALKAFPGRDGVQLNVLNGGAAIPLNFPSVQTGYCPELKRQLTELVGEDGFQVVQS
jgi:DNA polymerase III subunit alpha